MKQPRGILVAKSGFALYTHHPGVVLCGGVVWVWVPDWSAHVWPALCLPAGVQNKKSQLFLVNFLRHAISYVLSIAVKSSQAQPTQPSIDVLKAKTA